MDFLDHSIPVFGVLLCFLALAQLGFWAAQSWRIGVFSKQQFELNRELLRQQLQQRKEGRTCYESSNASTESIIPSSKSSKRLSEEATVHPDGTWRGFRKFRVAQLVNETPRCRSVYLTPVDEQPIASFFGGQHLPIRLNIAGQAKPVIRCYSLSNGPQQGHYRLSVKEVPAPKNQAEVPPGLVSNFINRDLKVGDVIEAKNPAGHFFAKQDSNLPMVMLAGGIGITPMVSMLEEAFAANSKRMMILFYGAIEKADQAFKKWLDAAAARHENFHVLHCYSSPGESDIKGTDFQVTGYVSIELLKGVLPNNECQFYLCGPPPFMDSLTTGLAEWGVPDDQIFSEAFGPASRKPKIQSSSSSVGESGNELATVRFKASDKSVAWSDQCESILELAEELGVEIDSGCRSGSCGTCTTKLLRGQVLYQGDNPDCEPGHCLPCIAIPRGEVELDA